MAPVVQTSTSLTGAAAANAIVTLPSGIQANDVVQVSLYKENLATVTPPAGFVEKGTAATSTAIALHTFWKRMAGGESGTVTFSWTGSVFREATANRISGCVASGDPIELFTTATSTGATALNLSLAGTSGNSLLYAAMGDFTSGTDFTPPSGFTEAFDGTDLGDSWKANPAGGNTGTLTYTATTFDQVVATLMSLLSDTGAVSLTDPQETFLPGATLLDPGNVGAGPLGLLYQPSPEQVPDYVPPAAAPDLAPQPLNRPRPLWRFRSRSAQLILPQADVPQVAVRNARPMLRRDASRTAGPVPDQVTAPATPPIPGIATHRQRWARRRSESAQLVPAQDAAPTNPPLAFLARARRVLFGRRLSDTTDPPIEQPAPPAQAHPRRPAPRLRTSSTAAPVAEQPAVSAPLERRRLVVRRRFSRSAAPTPTQQAAPLNPDFVLLNRERLRRLVRRGAGRTATPTPAQQAAPSNPEIVSAVHALRRRVFRRGHGRAAAPVPAQQAAVQNPDLVQLTRQHVRRVARRGSGRTAAPIPTQSAPVAPAFVPATLRRPRRVLRIHSRVASPPPEQLAPVQSSPSPLRALLRRARRRIAQVFPFVAPPVGRFITVEVVVGDDRYQIVVGDDRYQIVVGDADRYEVIVADDRYRVDVGDDRYQIEVG